MNRLSLSAPFWLLLSFPLPSKADEASSINVPPSLVPISESPGDSIYPSLVPISESPGDSIYPSLVPISESPVMSEGTIITDIYSIELAEEPTDNLFYSLLETSVMTNYNNLSDSLMILSAESVFDPTTGRKLQRSTTVLMKITSEIPDSVTFSGNIFDAVSFDEFKSGLQTDGFELVNVIPLVRNCPAEEPVAGDSCALIEPDLECAYGRECCELPDDNGECVDQCSDSFVCQCTDNIWACFSTDFCLGALECDPALSPTCPVEEPVAGDRCALIEPDLECAYGSECCELPENGECVEQCSDSLVCECTDNIWACRATEFCLGALECSPTLSPVSSNLGNPNAMGDPHFETFAGEKYDFHGVCDLVLLTNPKFEKERTMDIHIRTKQMKLWSFIAGAAIRIGDDIFELTGGKDNKFWINGILGSMHKGNVVDTISGYKITFKHISDASRSFTVDLGEGGSIVFKVWHEFVSVRVQHPTKKQFKESMGLMGNFPLGKKVARDNKFEFDTIDEFGLEWQVNDSDPNLFHEREGPQFPQKCEIPSKFEMRRRLSQVLITEEEAETACSLVEDNYKELCIFDVMATNDVNVAGAY